MSAFVVYFSLCMLVNVSVLCVYVYGLAMIMMLNAWLNIVRGWYMCVYLECVWHVCGYVRAHNVCACSHNIPDHIIPSSNEMLINLVKHHRSHYDFRCHSHHCDFYFFLSFSVPLSLRLSINTTNLVTFVLLPIPFFLSPFSFQLCPYTHPLPSTTARIRSWAPQTRPEALRAVERPFVFRRQTVTPPLPIYCWRKVHRRQHSRYNRSAGAYWLL